MNREEITIEIDEDGNTKVEAHGYKDGACLEATKAFEEALGAVEDREMKDREMQRLSRKAKTTSRVKAR